MHCRDAIVQGDQGDAVAGAEHPCRYQQKHCPLKRPLAARATCAQLRRVLFEVIGLDPDTGRYSLCTDGSSLSPYAGEAVRCGAVVLQCALGVGVRCGAVVLQCALGVGGGALWCCGAAVCSRCGRAPHAAVEPCAHRCVP